MKREFLEESKLFGKYLNMHKMYSQDCTKFGQLEQLHMEEPEDLENQLKASQNSFCKELFEDSRAEQIHRSIFTMLDSEVDQNMYSDAPKTFIDVLSECANGKNLIDPPMFTNEEQLALEKIRHYHSDSSSDYKYVTCPICHESIDTSSDNFVIHHVDGDKTNISLTNLMPLCKDCYSLYSKNCLPSVVVSKAFTFDACHFLPFHDKRCKFLHGHTYHLEISVKNKILQTTGMVIDFGKLKSVVEHTVLDLFDHGFINQQIEYPTCEIMVVWMWAMLSREIKGLYQIKLYETDGSYAMLDAKTYREYLDNFEEDHSYFYHG